MSEALDPPVFEAVIVPHRSLSRRGRRRLLGVLLAICATNAAVFVHMGAWPVGGFCGIELLLAAVLLQVNAHGAKTSELVLLSAAGLRIVRTDRHGKRQERLLPAGWLRISVEEIAGRVPRLVLRAGALREEIATSLGEAEKRDLAAALAQALQRWRSPVFDNPQLREPEPSQPEPSRPEPSRPEPGQPSSEPSDFIRS